MNEYTYTQGAIHGHGSSAFRGGVLLPNGKIILVPYNSTNIGIYDPATDTYADGPTHGKGEMAFVGGVLAPNGKVILMPKASENIGIYDPATDTYADGPTHAGEYSFYGGVLLPNGKIILLPLESDKIGIYDTTTNTYANGAAHGQGYIAFGGGVLAPNGKVILMPNYSANIGIYDPETNTYANGAAHGQGYNAFAGVVLAPNGKVILMPQYYSANIGIYDTTTNTYTQGAAHGQGPYAFASGVLAPNGKVILIPNNSANIGIYDPATDTYADGPTHGQNNAAFAGGVLAPNGNIILVPFYSANIGIITVTIPKCATPVATPAGGYYAQSIYEIELATETEGATIYYTLDGTEPDDNATLYSQPIEISENTTLKAIANATGFGPSDMLTEIYNITEKCETPVANPIGGTYTKQMQVALSCSTPGSRIYYTEDGSAPTTGSDEYSYAFYIYGSCTVKAIAVASGYSNSSVMSEVYTLILTSPTPRIYPPSGEYSDPFDVQLDAAFYQTFYYTTDGTDPTRDSLDLNIYGYPHITESTTVKARSSAGTGWNLSEVATAEYVFVSKSAPPTITPASGTYKNNIVAVIRPADAGSDIVYYTKDGTEPTYESQQATGESTEIIITETTTIKAFSDKPGFSKSETVTREYIITSEVTIYFDPRNGDAIFDEVVTYDASNYEVASLLPKPIDPIYAGHVFLGWYYPDPYGYSDFIPWEFDSQRVIAYYDGTVLTAQWEKDETNWYKPGYYVIFDSNGGSKISPYSFRPMDIKVKAPRDPILKNMIFDGWYTGLDFITKWNFDSFKVSDAVLINSTLTLYAKWKQCNITTSKLNKYSYTNLPSGELNGVKVSLKEY